MSDKKIVVDGSNIATEGRSLPSLAQLVEAVADFQAEFPGYEVIVVVDATFGHRIDPSERAEFEAAEAAGELLSPPAGAIGRGDAFLLRIADRSGAMVLSNDSFQEFHGEFEWLFDKGRLLGGKPVPGVGWIFTPRSPVRGPKSREAVKEAKRSRARDAGPAAATRAPSRGRGGRPKIGDSAATIEEAARKSGAAAKGGGRAKAAKATKASKAGPDEKPLDEAIAVAIEEVEHPDGGGGRRRRRRRGAAPSEPVNEPLPFLTFVSAHPPGSEVEGEIDSFSSHGAFVVSEGLRCYVPLAGLGDPPPRSAREVLRRGETARFVIQAFDPPRRGIELALPAFAHVSGRPTEETVAAEITEARPARKAPAKAVKAKKATKKVAKVAKAAKAAKVSGREPLQIEPNVEPVITEAVHAVLDEVPKAGRGRKAAPAASSELTPVAATPARTKTTAKKAPLTKAAAPAKKAPAKKAPAKKAATTTKKAAPPAKTAAKKVAAPAKKTAAKKAATPTKKTAAKKAAPATKKAAAPAKKTAAKKAAAPAKKAAAKKTAAPAKKTAAKKKTR